MAQRTFVLSNKVNMHNYNKFQKCLAVTFAEINKQNEWAKALLKIPLAAYFPLQQFNTPTVHSKIIILIHSKGISCANKPGRAMRSSL